MMFEDFFPAPELPATCPNRTCNKKTEAGELFCSRCNFDLLHGKLKNKKKAKCIYCSSSPVTDEHIFGHWLAERYPRGSNFVMVRSLSRGNLLPGSAGNVSGETIEKRIGHHYHLTVPNACEGCNGGWMRRLLNQASPLVIKLANGEWPFFTDEENHILSRWASMIGLNLEFYSRQRLTTDSQLDQLRNGGMPSGFRVGIRRMIDSTRGGEHNLGKTLLPNGDRIQSTFFVIENVAFHVISHPKGDLSLPLLLSALNSNVEPHLLPERLLHPRNQLIPEELLQSLAQETKAEQHRYSMEMLSHYQECLRGNVENGSHLIDLRQARSNPT